MVCFYVYFYGSTLKIASVQPFHDGENVGYFIAFNSLLLIIVSLFLFVKYRAAKQLEKQPKNEAEAKLLALAAYNEHQLDQLQHQRRKSTLLTNNFFYKVPWFLVLGKQGSGKSTLVDHFHLREKVVNEDDSKAYPIQWCVANDAVFIDVAGSLWEEKTPEQSSTWLSFKRWIATQRPEKPLNGLVLTLSVEDLIYATAAEQRQSASGLRNSINQLNQYYASGIPVYIVITQFDLLEGFLAFFKVFDHERIGDVFGFSLPLPDDDTTSWQTAYEAQFATLVRRLNRYLVHGIDEENTALSTQYYSFIRQTIGLKAPLFQLLQSLLETPPLSASTSSLPTTPLIRGVYFSAVVEQVEPYDSHPPQTFFSQHLPERLLLPEAWMVDDSLNAVPLKRKRFVTTYVLTGLLISTLTAVWLYLYEKNSQSVQQPLVAIEQYTQLKQEEHERHKNNNVYMKTLDILRAELERYKAEKTPLSQVKNGGFYRDDEIAQGVTTSYKRLLAQGFAKVLVEEQVSALEKYLQADPKTLPSNDSTGQDTLAWLRVIRLISESPAGKTASQVEELIAYRISLVRPWMIDYWHKRYQDSANSGSLQAQLLMHFDYALQHTGVDSNAVLDARIGKLQTTLAKVSLSERLYSQLKIEAQKNAPPFNLHYELGVHFFEVFALKSAKQQRLTINAFFTKAGFSQYYLASHEQLLKLVSLDAWVLGRKATPNEYTHADLQQIRAEISDLYARDYEQQWFAAIDALALVSFNDMSDAVRFLKAVSAKNNPYQSLVKTVRANTIFTGLYAKDKKDEKTAKTTAKKAEENEQATIKAKEKAQTAKKISLRLQDSFQYINELGELTAAKKPYINEMNVAFASLYKYMAKIQKASSNKKSLNKVLEGLNKAGKENPIDALRRIANGLQDPLQGQLYQIADKSQQIIMNLATSDLNQAWQKDVYVYYAERIKGKYPLASTGEDVSLKDFKAFFAPKGILATFYKRYLEKIATGEQGNVALSPAILDLYKQAEIIRTAFFNEAGAYSVAYTIETMELSNVYRNSVLNIDGVEIIYNHGKPVQKKMLWPNPTKNTLQTSLTLNPLQKDRANEYDHVSGEWAWFRFIDRAATISLSDRLRDIRFHKKTGVVDYRITVPQAMSPLTKDLLGRFTVPQTLTTTGQSSGAKE